MSNVALLPLIQAVGSVGPGEGLAFSFSFTAADGVTPLPLTGIGFTLAVNDLAGVNVFVGSTANGFLEISGDASATLSCAVPDDVVEAWPAGGYRMTLIASDGAATKGVFVESLLVVGPAQIWSLTTVMPSGSTLTGVAMNPPIVVVSSSQTVSKAAIYIVTVAGVTLTLNPPSSVNGPVTIKDVTGNADPNIAIIGEIDGADGLTFHTAFQSVTLQPLASRSIWGNVANAPPGPGAASGGNTIALTADTDLAAGTAISLNSAGHAVQTWGPSPNVAGAVTLFQQPETGWSDGGLTTPSILKLSSAAFVAFTGWGDGTGNPNRKAVTGAISGQSIALGTVNTDATFDLVLCATALSATAFVYGFVASGDLKLAVGTISGGVISLGTPVTVGSGVFPDFGWLSLATLSSTKVILCYGSGDVVVGDVSGSAITLGTPATGLAAGMPIVLDASNVVSLQLGTVTALGISGTSVTPGSSASYGHALYGAPNGAALDGTHFAIAWGDVPNGHDYQIEAAAGSLIGGTLTIGATVVVNHASETNPVGVVALSATEVAFFAYWMCPTFASVSGVTLTPTLGGALPLPWTIADNAQSGGGINTLLVPAWQSIVKMDATHVMFQDGEWTLYEASAAGSVSPGITHTGLQSYQLYPIDATRALVSFMTFDNIFKARVVGLNAIASRPIGCVASAVTSGADATITLSGACSGFTGLTPGAQYFANGDGTITTADTGHPIGIATTSSQLIVSPAKG